MVLGSGGRCCQVPGAGGHRGHPRRWRVMPSPVLARQQVLPTSCLAPGAFAELPVLARGAQGSSPCWWFTPGPLLRTPVRWSRCSWVGAGIHRLAPSCVPGCNGNP